MTAPPTTTASAFMGTAQAPAPVSGNSDWAGRYAGELRRVFYEHAARAPRTLQRHLGPSEIGVECHRQVAAKLAGLPATNHVMDPWPSIRGTALHAYAEKAFQGDNERSGRPRWITESRVTPFDVVDDQNGHSGTGDLFDGQELCVVDHKYLGETSLTKVRTKGPSRQYRVQLKLYAQGFRRMGLPVVRVVLAAYPATKASLDELYVWEEPYTAADDELLAYVEQELVYRKQWAALLMTGQASLADVPAVPSDDLCAFCDFYRPQTAHDGGPGCPGPRGTHS